MLRFDRLWVLVYRYGLGALMRSNGVNKNQSAQIMADPARLSIVRGIFQPVKTASLRQGGMRIDDLQINALPVERKLTAQVPTYIAHAANDPLAPPSVAASLAQGNAGIKFKMYPDGGHLFFVVHARELIPDLEHYLLENAPG